ncbi:MAG: ABC transporter ATP-binding protein [Campylobacter sp.]|nr:ABC transporter ATP-binding protein [Campylobacter sp.]
MKELVRIENLCKIYKPASLFGGENKEVLKNINLTIYEGQNLGLLGPSGCGKTTLAKIILGLETQTSGKIFILGKDISTLNKRDFKKVRSQVQVVFQDPYSSLDPRMTLEQSLKEPFIIHDIKVQEKDLKKLVSSVGISYSDIKKYPHEFSGGQRQRICIARALALKPKLIVLDEPVSSLDVSVQAQILNLLLEVKQEYNLTLLLISHDFAVCNFICDNIAIMSKGAIEEYGKVSEVLKNPRGEQTKKLLACLPKLQKEKICK